MDRRPIGVMDSGVGGISVLRELVKVMPGEDFIYFGDSKNAPYGTKTEEEVRCLTENVVTFLRENSCKAIVIACNTATSVSAKFLRAKYPELPIIGIEPAIKPAITEHPDGKVLVMATPLTLSKEKFNNLLEKYKGSASVISVPCAGLMEQVEEGHLDGEELHDLLADLLKEINCEEIDGVVLGCTHYPIVREAISCHFPKETGFYDGGEGTARETYRRLKELDLLSDMEEGGVVRFENSKNSEAQKQLCVRLLESR